MDPIFTDNMTLFMAGVLKSILHLFLLWLAFKFKNIYVGILAILLMIVQLTVISQSPPLLYIITSGLAHPMLAWVLYKYMSECGK